MFQGVAWSGIEKLSIQSIQFILGIILARILTPEEYGTIGILLVFIVISQVFIDSGFTKALIHRQNRSEADKATIFFFNMAVSLGCYLILWFSAPLIAEFYNLEILKNLLRVLSLTLIIDALYAVPATLFIINLNFKVLTKINFTATLVSGLIAIYLAYTGYGVWALAIQALIRSLITLLLMWFWTKWKLSWDFSRASLKSMFKYGSNLLASSLLNVTVNNFYALFIAKLMSTEDLGYYTRGTQFSDVVYGIFSHAINNVLLPGLAPLQDQIDLLVGHTRKIIKMSALVSAPVFLGLALLAEPLILILLTEKWQMAIPIMQIFCIARFITVISGISVNLLYVLGRTDLVLKQQYAKITIRVVFLVIALNYGIIYIALAELLSTIIHFFINTYYPGKIMKYGALKQIKEVSPIVLASVLMVGILYILGLLINNDFYQLLISPVIAILSYLFFLKLFKIEELQLLIQHSRSLLKSKNEGE